MRHLFARLLILASLLLPSAPGLCFGPAPAQPARPIPGRPAPQLLVGPYLLGPEPHQMLVQWETTAPQKAWVVFREGSQGEEHRADGLYQPKDVRLAGLDGLMYRATLRDLKACTRYQYRLAPFQTEFPHQFRTPPPPGEHCPGGLRVAALGDSRAHPDRYRKVVEAILPHEPDVVVNTGDIVNYAQQYEDWRIFFRVSRELLANAPLILSPGNHEYMEAPEIGAALMARYFATEHHTGYGHGIVDFGPVRFVVLDPYQGLRIGMKNPGHRWFAETLARSPKNQRLVVVIHTPVYSFGRHTVYQPTIDLRGPIAKHRVTAVLSGHAHCYEHFHREPTDFLTLGGGGASFHDPLQKVIKEEEHLLVKTGKFHHFALIDVHPEGVRYRVFDTDRGKVYEEFKREWPGK